MKCGAPAIVLAAALGLVSACAADGGPISGDYCAGAGAPTCATISFPAKRGTEVPGTMQLGAQRYELRWMETENGHRKFIANPPSGAIAFEMSATDAKTVVVKWRDGRPAQTYALK